MKRKFYGFMVFILVIVCVSPMIFTMESEYFDFTKTGDIGSTIGGITAPIVGLASVFLLTYTLLEQIKINTKQIDFNNKQIENNQKQRRIAFEEQFKSVFFSLLQVQRNIAESIKGDLFFLKERVDEVFDDLYFNDMYKIIKFDKQRGFKECCTIQKREEADRTKGNHFFISSKNQLSWLFFSIAQHQYNSNYKYDEAWEFEESLTESYYNEIIQYTDEEQNTILKKRRMPLRSAFYNTKYSISENAHALYKQSDDKKKIAIVYAHFYNKQPGLRHYFKHLLAILRYVKESEDECLNFKTDNDDIIKICSLFKSQAQFIASQMTNDEMVIVFYHAFLDNEFRELIIKYDLLKDLVVEDVLFGHNCLEGYTLKSRKTELNEMLGTI